MNRVIRLNESDINRIVRKSLKRVIRESEGKEQAYLFMSLQEKFPQIFKLFKLIEDGTISKDETEALCDMLMNCAVTSSNEDEEY